jgi:hypothetical protein
MQQLFVEVMTAMMMMTTEVSQAAMGCEMQAALKDHELEFDAGNHIRYHTPNCNTYQVLFNISLREHHL